MTDRSAAPPAPTDSDALLVERAAAGETGRQSSAPPMPTDPKDRKPGMTYTIPDGRRVVWDGKGAKLAR